MTRTMRKSSSPRRCGSTLDAALIAGAQKFEHYEIATYGTLATFAEVLNLQDAKDLLGQSLEEEKEADETLTRIAESAINWEAGSADSEREDHDDQEEDHGVTVGSPRGSSSRNRANGGASKRSSGSSSRSRRR